MSNQENQIPKEVVEGLNKDEEFKTKNFPHLQRVGMWKIYCDFIYYNALPALGRAASLILIYKFVKKFAKNGTISILINRSLAQDSWIILLILCSTFISAFFINKKF
jgi:hypothetical protein